MAQINFTGVMIGNYPIQIGELGGIQVTSNQITVVYLMIKIVSGIRHLAMLKMILFVKFQKV